MTESRRFKLKMPMSNLDRAVFERQMALYFDVVIPTPDRELEATIDYPYPPRDVDFTMAWWREFIGEPVLINKLRGRANQTLFSLNDLIHPETIELMTPPKLRRGAFPIHDWDAPGCGCVR